MKAPVLCARALCAAAWMLSCLCAQAAPDCSHVLPTPEVAARLDEARALYLAGKLAEVQKIVTPLLQRYPGTFRVAHVGALVAANLQQWDQASRLVHAAIELQSACAGTPGFVPDYNVYNTLGWVQMEQGDPADAQSNFELALSHVRQLSSIARARLQSNLGYLYFTQGDFEKARPLLRQAAASGNQNAAEALRQLREAEALYQVQHRKVQRLENVYYVVALRSATRADLEQLVQAVRDRLGEQRFNQQFPSVRIYQPNDAAQLTLLISSEPLPQAEAAKLQSLAIQAGFGQDTWLMPASDSYFSGTTPP